MPVGVRWNRTRPPQAGRRCNPAIAQASSQWLVQENRRIVVVRVRCPGESRGLLSAWVPFGEGWKPPKIELAFANAEMERSRDEKAGPGIALGDANASLRARLATFGGTRAALNPFSALLAAFNAALRPSNAALDGFSSTLGGIKKAQSPLIWACRGHGDTRPPATGLRHPHARSRPALLGATPTHIYFYFYIRYLQLSTVPSCSLGKPLIPKQKEARAQARSLLA